LKIETALNGKMAIDLVEKRMVPYDLILMDLHMPVLNGFEAAK
jgi:CheY-like chemotaxis protein